MYDVLAEYQEVEQSIEDICIIGDVMGYSENDKRQLDYLERLLRRLSNELREGGGI